MIFKQFSQYDVVERQLYLISLVLKGESDQDFMNIGIGSDPDLK
jgi:hypothetical protein